MGGLNIKSSAAINQALLAKKAWELLTSPSSLWGRLMKNKYFPNSNFLSANCPSTASWDWKSVCSAKELIRKGLFVKLGNGSSIDPWLNFWIPDYHPLEPPFPLQREAPRMVLDLIDVHSRSWKRDLVFHWWPPDVAFRIISIPIPIFQAEDKYIWVSSSTGEFSVSSAYSIAIKGIIQHPHRPWLRI
ncbi:uncharacterized mitochondrial protein AtMg00310-like [Telopea speciosissima]|uniref:uncharacterized mitochondrial protein AtMg00310-like n=1 Tax=Telopea speciosissima TaxID=54955 RepID=UPI001CC49030|nr:uncharacterized mitochondrial protein AtMg00310-like [Telopea speciosissima]